MITPSEFLVLHMRPSDLEAVVELQTLAFPPPFSPDLHWDREHLAGHIDLFPRGQFVAVVGNKIVGSCSNAIIQEERWQAHGNWAETVGGPELKYHTPDGSTLYGLDITVHPEYRRKGIGRMFYTERFQFVRQLNLWRYGTGCRLPDFLKASQQTLLTPTTYAEFVVKGRFEDRTLTPLLKMGLSYLMVVDDYMLDEESGNAAALLEWIP